MKKFISLFIIMLTFSAGFIFADSNTDPFDSLVSKLLKDCPEDDISIAVKVFNADLSNSERKKISKSVQFAFYCYDDVSVVSDVEDADYICSGKIETDGPNYILTAKIVDSYDNTVIAKAKQKVPKDYYADSENTKEVVKTETVIVEKEVDADDILGAVVVGTVIGGVFHALTTPSPRPRPHNPPRPAPKPRPAKPHRP